MKHIYGNDIGTTIDFRSQGPYEAQHPWPEETAVSAGGGVVLSDEPGKSYSTLFMEVYPPGASFIRGEGATPAECEDAAWTKYQRALHCIEPHTAHEFEPRDYKNGAGFCTHCGTFKSKAFTAEELGQFCRICTTPTMYHYDVDDDGNPEFLCEEHHKEHRRPRLNRRMHPLEELLEAMADDD